MNNRMKWSAAVIAGAMAYTAQADTIYVDVDNCPGPGSGFPWDPYCSIQTAIDHAVDTDEIEVAPGTYFETIDFLGKAIWLRSDLGPEVTIIDASGQGYVSVVNCNSGEGPDTILHGFTITGALTYDYGGGMYNDGSSPTVTDCIFTRNIGLFGGGMYNSSSNPTIIYCTFSESVAGNGGGMYNDASSPTVANCMFIGNRAGDGGGGMLNRVNSGPTLIGCTFSGNFAASVGGGMWNIHSSPTLTNCTFSGNTADYYGGGIINQSSSNPKVTNCIFWGNMPYEIFDSASSTVVTYSDVQSGWSGAGFGNIKINPLFVQAPPPPLVDCCFWRDGSAGCADPACEALVCEVDPSCCNSYWSWDCVELAGSLCGELCAWPANLRLSPGSPCIDAGDNMAVPKDITTDLDGRPRFVDDPDTVDTGNGDPPIVDMGAYEYQTHCPWDCGVPADGQVSVIDFLAMLSQWGNVGSPCDFDGGGVGVTDFLMLLVNWGPCP
jgi:parallel beta-helix repeat protein